MKPFIFCVSVALFTLSLLILTQKGLYQNDIHIDSVGISDTVYLVRDTVTIKFDTVRIYKKYYDTVFIDRVRYIKTDTSTCLSVDTLNDSVYIRADICGKFTGKIDSLRGLITYKLPDQPVIKTTLIDTIYRDKYDKQWILGGVAGGVILGGVGVLLLGRR
jgi:hypothetical protein